LLVWNRNSVKLEVSIKQGFGYMKHRHGYDTDTTLIIIWKIDAIECNHTCQCCVGVGHMTSF